MIKTVKVEDLVKYARNCVLTSNNEKLSDDSRRDFRIRAETIRALLASEDANRKYKPGTGNNKEWDKYFDEVWEEYDKMIFG